MHSPYPSSSTKYMTLVSLYVTTLVVGHLIANRYFVVAAKPLSCSILIYLVTFGVTGIITKVYGWQRAILLVMSGLFIKLLVHGLVWLAHLMPTAADSPVCAEAFAKLLTIGWGPWLAYLVMPCAAICLFEQLRLCSLLGAPLSIPQRRVQAVAGLASIFVAVLLLTNVITAKYFQVGRWVLTAGALSYPFTFTVLDIISELYGSYRARWVVWAGFVASLFMTLAVYVVGQLPAHPKSPMSEEVFQRLFGFTPGIVLGSMVAYLVAQLMDVALFAWGHRLTGGKHLWFRNNVSTLISQLLDTLLFGLIVWVVWPQLGLASGVGPLPWAAWYQLMLNEYSFKVIFTLLNTPLVYAGVYAVRKWQSQSTTL